MPEPLTPPSPPAAIPAPDELKNLLVIVRRCDELTTAGRAYLMAWLREQDEAAVATSAAGSSTV